MEISNKGYVVIALLVIGALVGGYMGISKKYGKELKGLQKETEQKAALGDVKTYTFIVNTWTGWAGGAYKNRGFKANTQSEWYQNDGFAVELKLMDDFDASRAAFKSGEGDFLWCTVDALPTEMETGSGLTTVDPKFFFQTDWSRGGDAIVVTKNITTVADLKGKSIAFAQTTPSHSLLINTLDAAGMKMSDVTFVKVGNAIEAAKLFQAGKVDAAVVWSPDDQDCVTSVPDAHVLVSTKDASYIIADGFLVRADFLAQHQDDIKKIVKGWLEANGQINNDDKAKREAAKYLAEGLGVSESWAYDGINKTRLATFGDNRQFFGIDPGAPVTAAQLYTRMSGKYSELGFVKEPERWASVVSDVAVNVEYEKTAKNIAEAAPKFEAPSKEVQNEKAVASKPLSISFATNAYQLDLAAKNTIDNEFVPNAKQFARTAYIRIEGNTDNTGNYANNVTLSKLRANAVKDYLVKSYNWPAERFIVKGNGPDKPLCKDGSVECLASNRRTDFELVLQK